MILDSGIPGFPSIYTTGNVFWVDSGSGADSDGAGAHDDPFATIDFAVGKCKANQGDYIICKPGHSEPAIATDSGIDMDVAGVSLVGLGVGSDRPTLTVTATGGDVQVGAANCVIHNFLFIGGIDAITGVLSVNAADCLLSQIETRDTAATQATDFIVFDLDADQIVIDGWVHRGDTAAQAASAVSFTAAAQATIKNFWIDGDFSEAAIENQGGAAGRLNIHDGYIRNRASSGPVAITLRVTASGNVGPNVFIRLDEDAANVTEATVGADMQFFQPIEIVNADGESSLSTNISVST